MPAQWQQARLDQTSSVESHQPARRTLRHVSLPASHIQRLTSFPSVKRERSAWTSVPTAGLQKRGVAPRPESKSKSWVLRTCARAETNSFMQVSETRTGSGRANQFEGSLHRQTLLP